MCPECSVEQNQFLIPGTCSVLGAVLESLQELWCWCSRTQTRAAAPEVFLLRAVRFEMALYKHQVALDSEFHSKSFSAI